MLLIMIGVYVVQVYLVDPRNIEALHSELTESKP